MSTKQQSRPAKLRFAQLKDNDDMSTDSNDSTPHRKRGKQEDTSMTYSNRFYTFFLGVQVNATLHGDLFWMKRDTMHSLFKKLMGKGANISKLQGIRKKWDRDLRDTCSKVYLQVIRTLVWSHILMKKLQSADWSTEEVGDEGHQASAWACSPLS